MKMLEQGDNVLLIVRILEKLSQKLRLEGNFDFFNLAKMTPGFVGADLMALTSEAGMIAVNRVIETLLNNPITGRDEMTLDDGNSNNVLNTIRTEPLTEKELESLFITQSDFINAMAKVQPSAKREGFATVPGVSWSDIGALSKIRDELRMAVVEPIKNPEYFVSVGISAPMGVLLYGPPGCGKTLLAKAVANESHCNFISVKGPELLNKVYICNIIVSMWVKVSVQFVWYLLEQQPLPPV
jgi:ribosome biogenesis ATPase